MFRKKRRILQQRFKYGKTPLKRAPNEINKGFQRQKRSPHKILKKLGKSFTLSIVLAIFILLFYWFFISNFFKVTRIEFSSETLEAETLSESLTKEIEDIIGKNIIFVKTEKIEKQLLTSFPAIEKISIQKKYPKTIILTLSEYDLIANIIHKKDAIKKTYIINSIGYVVKENFENPSLPYIVLVSEEPINKEIPAIEKTRLNYIINATNYFQDKFGMRLVEVEYRSISRELHLITERGFSIWLDIQHSYETQLKKLKKAMVSLDIYKENLDYIDLRIAGGNGNKIIYKRK
jgi:cell division septal protein FtsQ